VLFRSAVVLHGDQGDCDNQAGRDLQSRLGTCSKPEVAAVNDFDVIIGKADSGERRKCEYTQPNKPVAKVSPQECWDHNRDNNQQPAHGRRPSFFLVGFRAFFADVLADLKFLQSADD